MLTGHTTPAKPNRFVRNSLMHGYLRNCTRKRVLFRVHFYPFCLFPRPRAVPTSDPFAATAPVLRVFGASDAGADTQIA